MKKIYNLFVLAILFACAGSANAIYWEQTGDEPVLVPEAGVAYFIANGGAADYTQMAYLNTEGKITTTNAIAERDVWYFESAGENSWKVFCLVNGEKHYLAKSANVGSGFVTTTPSRINEIQVTEAVHAADADEAEINEYPYWTTKDLDGTQVFLIDANGSSYLSTNGSTASYGGVSANTTWRLIPAMRMTGNNYLNAIINELFPEGFDPDSYSVGINPGDYSEDALNALVEAYENASEGSGDDAECIQLAEGLIKAYEALKASFVNFGEGYYIFTTYRSSTGAMFDNTNNVSGAKNNR